MDLFGAENVVVELIDHLDPGDSERNDALAALAAGLGLPTVATNNVHYARPADGRMATACGGGAGEDQPGRAQRVAPGLR